MDTGTATLTNYKQSPRKVRLLADMVRGKEVSEALRILHFVTKRGSLPLVKLIESAWANVKNEGATAKDTFKIARIGVDQGIIMRRSMPRARGRAFPIKKRTSHITVVLERFDDIKKGKEVKAEVKPAVKAVSAPVKDVKVKKTSAKKKIAK